MFRLAYSSRVYHVQIPGILLQVVLLVAIRLAYMLAGSWVWQISPYRLDVNIGWLYGLGYAPILLILYLLNLRGYLNENEERILIAQRASRGRGTPYVWSRESIMSEAIPRRPPRFPGGLGLVA